jgi:hypothetical protein
VIILDEGYIPRMVRQHHSERRVRRGHRQTGTSDSTP